MFARIGCAIQTLDRNGFSEHVISSYLAILKYLFVSSICEASLCAWQVEYDACEQEQ